ncbi:MAG: hypothetical protein ACE5Q6_03540 [Dehalococcoidia bacterium]
MTTLRKEALENPREVMRENLEFLREYARRVIVEDDDTLTPIEDFKDALMGEYLAVGQSFQLTERDLVVLIFRGLPIPEYY